MRRLERALVVVRRLAAVSGAVGVVRVAGVVGVVTLLAPTPSQAQNLPPGTVTRQDNPARQPFQDSWGIPFDDPGDGRIDVPAGKRFVLEYVSLDVSIDEDCRVGFVSIRTTVGGKPAGHFVPIADQFDAGTRDVAVTAQALRLYADPESQADVSFGVVGLDCDPIGALSVSGHFVDVP